MLCVTLCVFTYIIFSLSVCVCVHVSMFWHINVFSVCLCVLVGAMELQCSIFLPMSL